MRVQKLEHVHDKTRRRYIAEHSIRGALSWLYTMAHTHFIIGVAPPGRTRRNDPLVKLIENRRHRHALREMLLESQQLGELDNWTGVLRKALPALLKLMLGTLVLLFIES